jgi:hypothetical protein
MGEAPSWSRVLKRHVYPLHILYLAEEAYGAGLGMAVARDIAVGSVGKLDDALRDHPSKANVIADIRERMLAEQKRIRDMEAARSREYRARKAEARQEVDDRTCVACGGSMKGRRADAVACSTKCRMRAHRHTGSLKSLALDPNMSRFKGTDGRSLQQRNDLAIACMRMPAEAEELVRKGRNRNKTVKRAVK